MRHGRTVQAYERPPLLPKKVFFFWKACWPWRREGKNLLFFLSFLLISWTWDCWSTLLLWQPMMMLSRRMPLSSLSALQQHQLITSGIKQREKFANYFGVHSLFLLLVRWCIACLAFVVPLHWPTFDFFFSPNWTHPTSSFPAITLARMKRVNNFFFLSLSCSSATLPMPTSLSQTMHRCC